MIIEPKNSVDRVLATGTGHGWRLAVTEALILGVMLPRWRGSVPYPR